VEDGQHQHGAEEPHMPEAGSTSPNLVTDIGVAKSSRKKRKREELGQA
jgi:hypothetical protein